MALCQVIYGSEYRLGAQIYASSAWEESLLIRPVRDINTLRVLPSNRDITCEEYWGSSKNYIPPKVLTLVNKHIPSGFSYVF